MKSCLGVLTCNPVTLMKATVGKEKKKHSKMKALAHWAPHTAALFLYLEKGLQSFWKQMARIHSLGYFIIIFGNTVQWIFVLIRRPRFFHADNGSKGDPATVNVLRIEKRSVQVGLP